MARVRAHIGLTTSYTLLTYVYLRVPPVARRQHGRRAVTEITDRHPSRPRPSVSGARARPFARERRAPRVRVPGGGP